MMWGDDNKAITRRALTAGLLACLSTILVLYLLRSTDILLLGTIDFIQYWSAADIFWQRHSNPYDLALLTQVQENTTTFRPLPVVMWNPPLILPLLLPLLLAPFPYVHAVWMVCSIVVYLRSLVYLRWILMHSCSEVRYSFYLLTFAITFYPFILTLSYGQISIFLLGSLVAFLVLARSQHDQSHLVGGVILSITLCKPHLLALCYVVLVVRAFRYKRERLMVLGVVIGAVSLAVITWGFNGDIWSHYWHAIKNPPYQWLTPTFGTWLQFFLSGHPSWSRYLPFVVAIPVVGVLSFSKKVETETLIIRMIPFSLFLAPYGWVYDQILLLPTLVVEVFALFSSGRLLSLRSRLLLAALGLVVESYYLPLGLVGQEYFVFVPFCSGVVLWCLRREQHTARSDA